MGPLLCVLCVSQALRCMYNLPKSLHDALSSNRLRCKRHVRSECHVQSHRSGIAPRPRLLGTADDCAGQPVLPYAACRGGAAALRTGTSPCLAPPLTHSGRAHGQDHATHEAPRMLPMRVTPAAPDRSHMCTSTHRPCLNDHTVLRRRSMHSVCDVPCTHGVAYREHMTSTQGRRRGGKATQSGCRVKRCCSNAAVGHNLKQHVTMSWGSCEKL